MKNLFRILLMGAALAIPCGSAYADPWGMTTSMGGVSAPIGNTQVRTSTGRYATPYANPDDIARYNYSRHSYEQSMNDRYIVQSNRTAAARTYIDGPTVDSEELLMLEMGSNLSDIDPASGDYVVRSPSSRVMGRIQQGSSYND